MKRAAEMETEVAEEGSPKGAELGTEGLLTGVAGVTGVPGGTKMGVEGFPEGVGVSGEPGVTGAGF